MSGTRPVASGTPSHEVGTVMTGDGVELHFRSEGEGELPPLVLIAGLADDCDSWGPVAPALAKGRQVVAFDNRGVGYSSSPPGPYTIAAMAADADALIDRLGPGPVDVLGSSMGGAIAMTLAARRPHAVRRLVLANTWLAREPFLDLVFEHWERLAREGHGGLLLEAGSLLAFSPDFLRANEERVGELIGTEPPPLAGYAAAAHACRHHDASSIVSDIEQPVLVLGGAQDALTRPWQSERLAEALPNSRLEWLDTGHMTFWEQPARFVALVRAFLEQP